jgi:hypothetical protein
VCLCQSAEVRELGSRERSQPAPPHAVWASLIDPRRSGARPWLELLADEVEPHVIEAVEPDRVVWSSLWPDRPQDRIRFDLRIADDGYSCALRWSLLTPDDPPSDSKLGHLRHRLNLLVNDRLRGSYGQ